MASPFSIFRRNTKVLMAAVTLMAMISFVFLPMIMRDQARRSAPDTKAITTKKYGDLQETTLRQLVSNRKVVINFMEQAMWRAIEASPPQGMTPEILNMYRSRILQDAGERLRVRFGEANERSVGETWLLARRADELGIVISNKAVLQFIQDLVKAFAGSPLSSGDMQQVFQQQRVSELQLLEALRTELKAIRLQNLFVTSLGATTPGQRWEYFQRLNRQANVGLVALPVEKFVDKVPDPQEAELRKFFDEHKDELPDPRRPEPGFREPQRAVFQSFKAEIAAFTDPKSVTDEEIKRYYEEHKDPQYLDTALPAVPPHEEPKPEVKPAETKSEAKPALEAKPAESNKSDKKDSKSSMWASASVQWVADSKPKDAPSADEKKADEKKDVPASEKKDEKQADASKPEAKPAPKYIPLEKVREDIRRAIARNRAMEKIKAAMNPLQEAMRQFGVTQIRYEFDRSTDANAQAPERPDIESMAKQAGLKANTTPMLDIWELAKLDIGSSFLDSRQPFVTYAFTALRPYYPVTSRDLMNVYLIWKTEETKERTPNFTDPGVQDRVRKAWKLIKARDLALEEAKRLTAEAQKSKRLLKDMPGLSVIEPPPFTWMTTGMIDPRDPNPPRSTISDVDGVKFAGTEFMHAVFALPEEGGFTVAMNQPKTVAYAIQVVSFKPSTKELQAEFMNTNASRYASVAMLEKQQMYRAWLNEMKTQAGFQWHRKPDSRDEDSSRPVHDAPAEDDYSDW